MRLRRLDSLSRDDVSLVGGKAANLGELSRFGASVPKGFVIPVPAHHQFVTQHLDQLKARVGVGISPDSDLHKYLINRPLDPKLSASMKKAFDTLSLTGAAVRSSATVEDSARHSFAGIFGTELHVQACNLDMAVKACWLSAFSPRAVQYIGELRTDLLTWSMAVIVQEMVAPDVSGVCFTRDPVSGKWDHLLIEAVLGLGDQLVSGRVTPDAYVFDKVRGSIVERSIATQKQSTRFQNGMIAQVPVSPDVAASQKLTDHQIRHIVTICESIEEHFGAPQDVEFAVTGDELFLLQTRPITTT